MKTLEQLQAKYKEAYSHFKATGEYVWLAEVAYAIHNYKNK